MEDIVADTNIPEGEIPSLVKELTEVRAVTEDDGLPNFFAGMHEVESKTLGKEKGYDFSVSSLPDLFAVNKKNLNLAREEIRSRRGKPKPMPTNLMNILGDDNLAAMVIPNSPKSKPPSQEELMVFVQQMAQQQQMTQMQQQQQMQQQ